MRNSKRIRYSAALRQNRRYCTGLGGGLVVEEKRLKGDLSVLSLFFYAKSLKERRLTFVPGIALRSGIKRSLWGIV